MSALFSLLAVILAFASCNSENAHKGRVPLAAIDDTYLYKDEVELVYATYGQGTDSLLFFKDYVERWVVERLFYKKASENVVATNEIDNMVENYRRGLILSVYQDRLIDQQLVPDISHDEIEAFYNENESMFELDEPMFKGMYMKVSDKSPNLSRVRSWCMRKGSEDLERLEKYSLANASVYDSFLEEWRTVSDVAEQTPITGYQLNERLKKKETIEFRQGGYTYFISADTLIQKGDRKPLEMVSGEIVDLLVNSKKVDFIKEKKQTLYDEALLKGDIVVY